MSIEEVNIFYLANTVTDRLLLDLSLSKIGIPYELNVATNGKEALTILENDISPDLILVDLESPYHESFAGLKLIRDDERFDSVPVIVLSGSTKLNSIQEAYNYKANLYVAKPYDLYTQIELLKTLLAFNWQDYFPQPPAERFVFKPAHLTVVHHA